MRAVIANVPRMRPSHHRRRRVHRGQVGIGVGRTNTGGRASWSARLNDMIIFRSINNAFFTWRDTPLPKESETMKTPKPIELHYIIRLSDEENTLIEALRTIDMPPAAALLLVRNELKGPLEDTPMAEILDRFLARHTIGETNA